MRKKTNSNTNHTTGERNISSNGNNTTFSTGKDSNINYNKTELSNHGALFTIILLLIMAGNILFAIYLLGEVNNLKTRMTEQMLSIKEKTQDLLEEQNQTLANILEVTNR